MDWFKANGKYILTALMAVLGAFGVVKYDRENRTITLPPELVEKINKPAETVVVIQEGESVLNAAELAFLKESLNEGPGVRAAVVRDKSRQTFNLLRTFAAIKYAREHGGTIREAKAKADKVTDEQIRKALVDSGKVKASEIGDGTFLKWLMDTLSDPEFWKKLAEILALFMMFM